MAPVKQGRLSRAIRRLRIYHRFVRVKVEVFVRILVRPFKHRPDERIHMFFADMLESRIFGRPPFLDVAQAASPRTHTL